MKKENNMETGLYSGHKDFASMVCCAEKNNLIRVESKIIPFML